MNNIELQSRLVGVYRKIEPEIELEEIAQDLKMDRRLGEIKPVEDWRVHIIGTDELIKMKGCKFKSIDAAEGFISNLDNELLHKNAEGKVKRASVTRRGGFMLELDLPGFYDEREFIANALRSRFSYDPRTSRMRAGLFIGKRGQYTDEAYALNALKKLYDLPAGFQPVKGKAK